MSQGSRRVGEKTLEWEALVVVDEVLVRKVRLRFLVRVDQKWNTTGSVSKVGLGNLLNGGWKLVDDRSCNIRHTITATYEASTHLPDGTPDWSTSGLLDDFEHPALAFQQLIEDAFGGLIGDAGLGSVCRCNGTIGRARRRSHSAGCKRALGEIVEALTKLLSKPQELMVVLPHELHAAMAIVPLSSLTAHVRERAISDFARLLPDSVVRPSRRQILENCTDGRVVASELAAELADQLEGVADTLLELVVEAETAASELADQIPASLKIREKNTEEGESLSVPFLGVELALLHEGKTKHVRLARWQFAQEPLVIEFALSKEALERGQKMYDNFREALDAYRSKSRRLRLLLALMDVLELPPVKPIEILLKLDARLERAGRSIAAFHEWQRMGDDFWDATNGPVQPNIDDFLSKLLQGGAEIVGHRPICGTEPIVLPGVEADIEIPFAQGDSGLLSMIGALRTGE